MPLSFLVTSYYYFMNYSIALFRVFNKLLLNTTLLLVCVPSKSHCGFIRKHLMNGVGTKPGAAAWVSIESHVV